MAIYYLDGYKFNSSSKIQYKKYDVYKDNKYMVSFGDKRYQQYYDKIGHYRSKDHKDEKRRQLYNIRHKKDKDIKLSAGWFASHYLW